LIQGVSSVSISGGIRFTDSAAITANSVVTCNAVKKWEPEPVTPETWTPEPETNEDWTVVAITGESWTPVANTNETWTPISVTEETWQQAA